MRGENIQMKELSAVQLICVSCGRRQIVHMPEWRCFTKEIHMVCLECQENGSVCRESAAGTRRILRLAVKDLKGGGSS